MSTGYIYFVRAFAGGYRPVKIGWARDPIRRLAELQRSHPQRLGIVGTLRGTMVDERELHKRFAAHRMRGEWFKPKPEILELAAGGLRVNPWGASFKLPTLSCGECRP